MDSYFENDSELRCYPLFYLHPMKAHKISEFKLPLARLGGARVPMSPGVYVLYRTNMGAAAWVGRHDNRLGEALDQHRKRGIYSYFKYMVCASADDAFEWECMFWHQAQKTIDNNLMNGGKHPRLPLGSEVRCPFPGCTYVHEVESPVGVEAEQENA
jgi:hypothetical protein